jgi:uncharacterized membrane protein YedE/YeeE
MKTKKEINQLWRIPLAVVVLTSIVYLIIFLIKGSIPSSSEIVFFSDSEDPLFGLPRVLILPFAISRAWDILFAPILAFLFVWILQIYKSTKDENPKVDVFVLIFGFIFGLIFVLIFGFIFGPIYALIFGLIYALIFGFIFGLIFGLIYALIFVFTYGIVFLLKKTFSPKFWKFIFKWFSGE